MKDLLTTLDLTYSNKHWIQTIHILNKQPASKNEQFQLDDIVRIRLRRHTTIKYILYM